MRKSFILLMSLVLIALAGVLLGGLAQQSLLIIAEARAARCDLQRRWGTVFLSRVILADPESWVARQLDAYRDRPGPLPIRESLQLGELTFRVTLDDENRKLNLNRLRGSQDAEHLLQMIHRFAGGGLRVDLRPMPASSLGVRPFDSWGHVLDFLPSDDARQQCDQIEELCRMVTCWGSGKVNMRRCEDEVLRTVGNLAAGPVTANRLVALRENEPRLERDALLTRLATDARKLAVLKGWLSDASDCYALWIVAGDRRASLDLFVRENTSSESHTVKHFQW